MAPLRPPDRPSLLFRTEEQAARPAVSLGGNQIGLDRAGHVLGGRVGGMAEDHSDLSIVSPLTAMIVAVSLVDIWLYLAPRFA